MDPGELCEIAVLLTQLCPTRGPLATQSRVLCGPVYFFAVIKVSDLYVRILRTCLYFDNLEFDILDAGRPQCHFIIAVKICS